MKKPLFAVLAICLVLALCGCGKQNTAADLKPTGYTDGEAPEKTLVLRGGKLYYEGVEAPLEDLVETESAGISCDLSGEYPVYTLKDVRFISKAPVALIVDERAEISVKGSGIIVSGAYDKEDGTDVPFTCGILSDYPLSFTGDGVLEAIAGDALAEGVSSVGIKAKSITVDGSLILYALSGAGSAANGFGAEADEITLKSGEFYCGGDSRQKNGGIGVNARWKLTVESGGMLAIGSETAVSAGELDIKPNVYAMIYDEEYDSYYGRETISNKRTDGQYIYFVGGEPADFINITAEPIVTREDMIAQSKESE